MVKELYKFCQSQVKRDSDKCKLSAVGENVVLLLHTLLVVLFSSWHFSLMLSYYVQILCSSEECQEYLWTLACLENQTTSTIFPFQSVRAVLMKVFYLIVQLILQLYVPLCLKSIHSCLLWFISVEMSNFYLYR